MGSLVRFRFHGKLTKGWVLGPTEDVPARTLPVMRLVSPQRFFDEETLALARWVSERYVAPLATVLERLSPPRVAEEEANAGSVRVAAGPWQVLPEPSILPTYTGGPDLLELCRRGSGAVALRPAPEDERTVAVEAVSACLAYGRRALVLVPEASPVPATATAILEAFGDRSALFLGGDRRTRFRTWRLIQAGGVDVVVGTRPAVFAPIGRLGLIYVSRESHPAHREDRSPYYHVRDVALTRARRQDAVLILAALCHSSEAAALGLREVAPIERRWPKVEVVRPGPEGRAPRLLKALHDVRRAFVLSPRRGYGTAQVCRSCGAPAACGPCGGLLRQELGLLRCVVCSAPGRCPACASTSFGIRRGGAERVAEWAAGVASVPVREVSHPRLPRSAEILVGGPEDVRDLGPGGLDLVAVLDADLAARRPGLASPERALSKWMEAIGWARPSGRAIVQASEASDPMVQALVRGNPDRFHVRERRRRAEAGFPVGSPVFRVLGDSRLEEALTGTPALTSLASSLAGRTVCLLALEAQQVPAFGVLMRDLAARGIVERVEAEPHL